MFEDAELGLKVGKEEFAERARALRTELLAMQRELRGASFPVIVVLGGVDGAGKGDTMNLFYEWMDARGLEAHAMGPPTEEERQRPEYWRYWMALPGKGRIGIFLGSWYTEPIVAHATDKLGTDALHWRLATINRFEKALVDDGALIVKLWFHLSRATQKRRLRRLEKNPETRWRVTKRDWKGFARYDDFRRTSERALRETSTGEAPWTVIEGTDERYRGLAAAEHLLAAVRRRLERARTAPSAPAAPAVVVRNGATILDRLDLSGKVESAEYRRELEALTARLNKLGRRAKSASLGAIALFEGCDAAGKGGAIRRITHALDARYFRVIPIAAPTDEERAHHYLWRFWRHLPRLGHLTIYDRSWYGRVLVERVEGFATEDAWMRAYHEINHFEETMHDAGIVLVKYWIQISKEEQLARFQAREQSPWKQYKITEEDYRNREKWDAYQIAANDMIGRTSTEFAPWTLVSGEDKNHGRIAVLRALCDRLEGALDARKGR